MYFNKHELKGHFESFVSYLVEEGCDEDEIESRIAQHYTNKVIRIYSKQEQDAMWAELMSILNDIPGGVGMLIDNMDYMPEFEHYNYKCLKSSSGYKGSKSLPKHL